jgi:formylglycine-generating enzyme required for sulfatase activity
VDDGVTAHTHQQVTEGGTVTKPVDPTRDDGYGFEYWFNTATNIEWNFNTAVTANITLKAKWSYQSLYVQMVYVGGGSFEMGDDDSDGDESPAHTVTLTGFYIGKYEITQKEWETVMDWVDASPSTGEGDNYPVYNIFWYDTLEFCNRLSILEGLSPAYSIRGTTDPDEWGAFYDDWETWEAWDNVYVVYGSNGYRLPTEAQWEYAAKGGPLASKPYYTYSGSNNANEVANIGGSLMEVGSKNPNQLGLYDMSGNVFEWCWDWYDEEYYWDIRFDPMPNPPGPFSGSDRVMRGGSYRAALYARSVKRLSEEPDEYHDSVGFRIARPAQ